MVSTHRRFEDSRKVKVLPREKHQAPVDSTKTNTPLWKGAYVSVTAKGSPSGTATTTMVTAMEKYLTIWLPCSPPKLL